MFNLRFSSRTAAARLAGAAFTLAPMLLMAGGPKYVAGVSYFDPAVITASSTSPVLTNSSGIASKALAVGSLAEGQEASATACVNGSSQCVTLTAAGAPWVHLPCRRLRHCAEHGHRQHTEPDRPARHERRHHGGRHGHALPGALCLGVAIERHPQALRGKHTAPRCLFAYCLPA